MDVISWGNDEEIYTRGPVYDKNGEMLMVGDTVHYKTDAREYTIDGCVRTKPAVDKTFVIDGFKNSPHIRSRYHSRGFEDPTWVTGVDFTTPRGTKNSVSPRVLVKVGRPLVKKQKPSFTFIKKKPNVLHLNSGGVRGSSSKVGGNEKKSILQKLKEFIFPHTH